MRISKFFQGSNKSHLEFEFQFGVLSQLGRGFWISRFMTSRSFFDDLEFSIKFENLEFLVKSWDLELLVWRTWSFLFLFSFRIYESFDRCAPRSIKIFYFIIRLSLING